ncbi:methylated-DNA--[protein]-cysteine S-methyltransferase [Aliarcobacter butzleri]|uniref:methylated-DNA--[protein]-cysteine S-methyltransferase n=1 Tax=Aliarcobacter butzleri TaxID=28197 RepID=UPI003AFACF85
MNEYFLKKRTNFTIPLKLIGTPFQIKVWEALLKIPYGKTISYKEEAKMIENEKAFRAVANANGKNNLSIIVPCHRVISNNGEIGGYTGGVEKKEFLLKLEQNDK